MNGDRRLAFEFVTEARDHLGCITDDLLTLEKAPDDSAGYRVDRLFRAVHSIKGGAGFVGLKTIAALAHLMETLLGQMRQRDRPPESEQLDALLAGADRIAVLLDDVERSNEADITVIRQRLEQLLEPAARLPATAPPAGRAHRYALSCDLTAQAHRGRTPLALVQALQAAAEVIEGRLEVSTADLAAGLPQGPVIYRAVLASPLDRTSLARTLDLAAEDLRPLDGAAGPGSSVSVTADGPPPSVGDRTGSIRVHVDLLDHLMTLAGELVLVRNQALQALDVADVRSRPILRRLNSLTSELQDAIMRTRLQPVGALLHKFPRLVRDLARQLDKQIELVIEGSEVELDKSILEMLTDPLTHMVRNACDHGIETPDRRQQAGKSAVGRIYLRARHDGSLIHIQVQDDGQGIDTAAVRRKALQSGLRSAAELAALGPREMQALVLLPGFTTADQVTDLSGRGVGLDVVKTNLDRLSGSLAIDSEVGRGTTFDLRLPLTVAIIPSLVVQVGADRYVIPQKDVEELVCLLPGQEGQIEVAHDQEVYRRRDRLLPLVRLHEVLERTRPFDAAARAEIIGRYHPPRGLPPPGAARPLPFAVVKSGGRRFGLIFDRILTTEEIVVKPMQSTLRRLRCFAGTTILGDGQVVLILDVDGIARHAGTPFELPGPVPMLPLQDRTDRQPFLLCRAGSSEQFALALALVRRIERIRADRLERIGPREFVSLDGTAVPILRLDRCLDVSPCPASEFLILVLPAQVPRPVGLLFTEVLDTVLLGPDLDTQGYCAPGVLGTVVVAGKLTVVLDVARLADNLDQMPPLPGPGRKRILLVDDTQFFRQLVRSYLEGAGYEVVTADHGSAGLAELARADFDLVVSDLEMPVMDGLAFAQAVRAKPGGQQIPLLALTTRSSDEDQARARACGFDRYEVKLERERFLIAVAELLAEHHAAAN